VPRGSAVPASGWTFARGNELGHRERARWRTAPDEPGVTLRAVANGETLDRNLRAVPFERSRALAPPAGRREAEVRAATDSGAARAAESGRAGPRSSGFARDGRAGAVERGGSRAGARSGALRELFSAPRAEGEPPADLSERRAQPGEATSPEAGRRARPGDTERDVLRRFFAPLSRPAEGRDGVAPRRPQGDDGSVSSQPRSRGESSGERGGSVRSVPRRDSNPAGVRSQPRSGSSGDRSSGVRSAPRSSGATGARAAPRRETSRPPERERSRPKPPER
jgi:hypothetical protein